MNIFLFKFTVNMNIEKLECFIHVSGQAKRL